MNPWVAIATLLATADAPASPRAPADAMLAMAPARGASGLAIATLDPGLPPGVALDGGPRRALVRAHDGSIVVMGPPRARSPFPSAQAFVPALQLPPTIDEAAALEAVADCGLPGAGRADAAALVLTARGRLAWRVDPPVVATPTGPSNPVFLVDAATGAVRLRHDRVRDAMVRSWRANPVATPDAQEFELFDIDPRSGTLQGPRVAAFNCVEPEGEAICGYATVEPTNEDGDFLYDAPDIDDPDANIALEDDFSVVSAYYHADAYLEWLQDFGIDGLLCHEEGDPIVLVANYKSYLGERPLLIGNAAWTGDCGLTASFGQGPEADWAYDGDVVSHELTHGVIELLLDGENLRGVRGTGTAVLRDPGALGEGLADFVASVYTGDPAHAEYVGTVGTGSGRQLDNDFTCPASLTGQIHADGEIVSGALWTIYLELGEDILPVLFDAIALLPEDATFEEFAEALVGVAEAELAGAAAAVVTEVLTARGLVDCPREVAVEDFERELWLYPRGQGGKFTPMQPPPLQLAVPIPPDTEGLVVRFEVEVIASQGFEPITDVHVLLGYHAPIEFSYTVEDDDTIVVDALPDEAFATIDPEATDEGFWIPITDEGIAYVVLFNQSPNITILSEIEVEIVPSEGDDDDDDDADGTGGDDDDDTDDDDDDDETGDDTGESGDEAGADDEGNADGCGCTAPRGAPSAPSAAPLLVVMLGALRRRRVG